MATWLNLFLSCITLFKLIESYGTCDDGYHIEKNTIATSDSHRDYYYAYNIFPYLDDQDASHFVDGMCGNQMKVQLPDTCFKLHAPQTWQHDSGLLNVDILEKKNSKKWQHVMSDNPNTYHYDSFLDFNFAFYVESLDPYIAKWEDFNSNPNPSTNSDGVEYNDKFEYIGIEWEYNIPNIDLEISSSEYKNNKWYSLLIHSPKSNLNYEFMSFIKPSSKYHDNVKWIKTSIPRASFLSQSAPYPWNRPDQAKIVPARLSRAVTNLDETIDFYTDVMESEILYNPGKTIVDDLNGDNIDTKTVILHALDTQIEIQFYERPIYYTAGDFDLQQYEQLLIETHDQVITTPFCGIDRWFDNHFGFTTWSVDGYLDRIVNKLNIRNKQKYRIYQSTYEHSSPDGKANLDKYGKKTVYIFFIFEPSGQTIQMMGDFPNTNFGLNVPNWSAQWCYKPCPYGMHDGIVNQQHIYIDTENYDPLYDDYNDKKNRYKYGHFHNQINNQELHLFGIGSSGQEHHEKYLLGTITAMICGLTMCGLYYAYKKYKKKRYIQSLLDRGNDDKDIDDTSPLISTSWTN